jgi:hypothetical protein
MKLYYSPTVPPLVWRECIKKIWEVDPLLCTHCGGLMKIVSFIYKRKVVRKILVHLGLFKGQVEKRGPPTAPERYPETIVEPFDDGWSEYDESIIDVQAL